MEAQIISPEVEKSTETALTIINDAKSLVISTTEDYQLGQMLMSDVKTKIKTLEEIRMGQTRPLDESKKKIMDFFRIPIQKLEDAKNYLNQIMVKWVDEQERKRKEEERRLQEIARKRAEEEALQQALEAEAAGEPEEAQKIIEEPVYVPPIRVASEIPKSKDSHIREVWNAEIISLDTLLKAVAEGKAPIEAIEPNMSFLNGQARAYKQALNIPGVKACSKKIQI
jgi:hypothetical protein